MLQQESVAEDDRVTIAAGTSRTTISLAAAKQCTFLECVLEGDGEMIIVLPPAIVSSMEAQTVCTAVACIEAACAARASTVSAAAVCSLVASLSLAGWAEVCSLLHFLGPTGRATKAVAWVVDSLDPIRHYAGGGTRGIEVFLRARAILPADAMGTGWATVRGVLLGLTAALHGQPLGSTHIAVHSKLLARAVELDELELAGLMLARLLRWGWEPAPGEYNFLLCPKTVWTGKGIERKTVMAVSTSRKPKRRREGEDPAAAENGWDGVLAEERVRAKRA
jgi:hypothetical protein